MNNNTREKQPFNKKRALLHTALSFCALILVSLIFLKPIIILKDAKQNIKDGNYDLAYRQLRTISDLKEAKELLSQLSRKCSTVIGTGTDRNYDPWSSSESDPSMPFEPDTESFVGKYVCEYDSFGRIIHSTAIFQSRAAETFYFYDNSGRLCASDTKDGAQITYSYNTSGMLVSELIKYSSGKPYKRTDNTYNDLNQLIRTEVTSYASDGTEHITVHMYIYDEGGRVTRKDDLAKGEIRSRFEYEYDKRGNKTAERYYIFSPSEDTLKLSYQIGYQYDEKGNLIREDQENGRNEYTYNKKGQLTKTEIFYGESTVPSKRYTYTYTDFGLLKTEKADTLHYDDIVNSVKTTYTYDSYGSLIEKRTDYPSGEPDIMTYSNYKTYFDP